MTSSDGGMPGRTVRSQDPKEAHTRCGQLTARYCRMPWDARPRDAAPDVPDDVPRPEPAPEASDFDMLKAIEARAVSKMLESGVIQKSHGFAIPWGVVFGRIRDALPPQLDGRDDIANRLVVRTVTESVGGAQGEAWHTERRGPKATTFIVVDASA